MKDKQSLVYFRLTNLEIIYVGEDDAEDEAEDWEWNGSQNQIRNSQWGRPMTRWFSAELHFEFWNKIYFKVFKNLSQY